MLSKEINKWKVGLISLLVILIMAAGFIIGRKTVKPAKPEIIYQKGDSIRVEVPYPVPVEVIKPVDTVNIILACIRSGKYYELFPEKVKVRDSIIYVTKEDTSSVLLDWATERIYEEKMFDIDTVGKAVVRAKVQYNRLSWLNTSFTPVTKVVYKPQPIKKFSPFVGGGISTMPAAVGEVGMFFEEKYGFSGLYQYDWEQKKHSLSAVFLYKF